MVLSKELTNLEGQPYRPQKVETGEGEMRKGGIELSWSSCGSDCTVYTFGILQFLFLRPDHAQHLSHPISPSRDLVSPLAQWMG